MNQETRNYINQWILKTNEDLLVVEKPTEFDIIATSSVCFHCQQAAEKFLKAYLINKSVDIKRTHNIEFLLAECAAFDSDFSEIDPKNLNDFGVEVRYPGDMYIPSNEETIEHKEIVIEIKMIVEKKLSGLIH